MLKKYNLKYFIIIFVLFLIDFISKFVFKNINLNYKNWGFLYVLNKGSSFSLFANINWYNLFIIFLSIFILISIFVFNKKFGFTYYFEILLVCGILGNLVDRIFFKAVRDIFMTPFFIFNVADFYLSLAFVILIYNIIFKNN